MSFSAYLECPVETENTLRLADVFVSISDQGHAVPVEHNLLELLAVAVNAVLVGADTFADIELWANERRDWLQGYLRLESGIPSHDLFGRVFGLMATGAFDAVCRRWLGTILPALKSGSAADFNSRVSPPPKQVEAARQQLAGAFAAGSGLILSQRATTRQSNEPAANDSMVISELLASLSVSECVVAIDAPGASTELAQTIRDQRGDYLLALKGGHPALAASLRDFHARFMSDPSRVPHAVCKMTGDETDRGEARRCFAFAPHDPLVALKKWRDLRSFAITESERSLRGQTFVVPTFYISSLPADAERLAKVVGSLVSSKTPPLWHLSITFADDQMRVRARQAARNLAALKQITENLIRSDPVKRKGGVRARRFVAAISDDYRSHLLGLA